MAHLIFFPVPVPITVTTSTKMACTCCCQKPRIFGSDYCYDCGLVRNNMVQVPKCKNCGFNSQRIGFEFCSNDCGWEYRTRPAICLGPETINLVSSASHVRNAIQNEYNSRQPAFSGFSTFLHFPNGR